MQNVLLTCGNVLGNYQLGLRKLLIYGNNSARTGVLEAKIGRVIHDI